MLDIKKLCEEAHTNAKEKGFLDKPRTWEDTVNLFHSELAEATEDYRKHHKVNELYFEASVIRDGATDGLTITLEEMVAHERAGTLLSAKPCGISVEMADFVIRIAQYCGTENIDLAASVEKVRKEFAEDPDSQERVNSLTVSKLIAGCHALTSDMYIKGMANSSEIDQLFDAFAEAVLGVELFFANVGVDFEKVVKMKMDYNKTRSYRHGNKLV